MLFILILFYLLLSICIIESMKFLWYFICLSTIFLILVSNPKTNAVGNFISQDKMIKLNNNSQILLQRIIMIMIILFFILTIYCIIYL